MPSSDTALSTHHQPDINFTPLTLQSDDRSTSIIIVPERGATVSSWKVNQTQELLYQHPYFWDQHISDLPGGIPFCFPHCGRLEYQGRLGCYKHQQTEHRLPIHGLAWTLPWTVQNKQTDCIDLELCSSPSTRAHYPFDFQIQLQYTVNSNRIQCHQRYCNTGTEPMPFSAGFHPYFLTDDKANTRIHYRPSQHFQYNAALTEVTPSHQHSLSGSTLDNPKINEQLCQTAPGSPVYLEHPQAGRITMNANAAPSAPPFSYLQLYTDPDLPFFCAEPWMSPPNALNHPPYCQWLEPGACQQATLVLEWQPA